jgi:xanthine dehydrogenase accessory factor
MQSLIQELDSAIRSGRSACYTALVETRGSTPQKAGAAMLVFPDGSQVGTLGGGCVEAEVKRRALQVLQDGSIELMTFQLDSDYGWDDGLICGGRMKMLVDPVRPGEQVSYYSRLLDTLSAGRGATEAIVIDSSKSGGGADGDRWLLDEQGSVLACRSRTFAGTGDASPPVPTALAASLKPLEERPRPYIASGISFLPYLERCRLVIVGAGHVGQKVAELASEVGFDVWVVDDRQEYCNSDRFPSARRLIVADFDTALRGLQVDSNTYCIIVTRGHNHDEQALFHLATTPARYLGMIGSRRKIKLIFEDLQRDGIPREALQQVHAPLGFDIGSQTVPEIAVSIVAELIAHRNIGQLPERVRPASVLEEQ